jgi:hypothetical protein
MARDHPAVFLTDLGENENSRAMVDNREWGGVCCVRNEIAEQVGPSIYSDRLLWFRILDESETHCPGGMITETHRGAHAFTGRRSRLRGCHDHDTTVNQATMCLLSGTRRTSATIFQLTARASGHDGDPAQGLCSPHPGSFHPPKLSTPDYA